MFPEQVVNGIGQPGGVPELEREAQIGWQRSQKVSQKRCIALESRGKLKQNRTQAACGPQGIDRAEEDLGLSLWMCVIRMCAFKGKTNPLGVAFTQLSSVEADGSLRNV